MLVSCVLLAGCRAIDPINILNSASAKSENIDYMTEYEIKTKTVVDNEIFENKAVNVIKKSGINRQVEIYVKDIVLVQSITQNKDGLSVCSYVNGNSCWKIGKKTEFPSYPLDYSKFKLLIDKKIVKIKSSEKKVNLDNQKRSCDLLEYSVDTSKITADNLLEIVNFASGMENEGIQNVLNMRNESLQNSADFLKTFIKEIKVSFCLDKETGLPLETKSFVKYQIKDTNIEQETEQKMTYLEINPDLSANEFETPLTLN